MSDFIEARHSEKRFLSNQKAIKNKAMFNIIEWKCAFPFPILS